MAWLDSGVTLSPKTYEGSTSDGTLSAAYPTFGSSTTWTTLSAHPIHYNNLYLQCETLSMSIKEYNEVVIQISDVDTFLKGIESITINGIKFKKEEK